MSTISQVQQKEYRKDYEIFSENGKKRIKTLAHAARARDKHSNTIRARVSRSIHMLPRNH